MFTYFLMGVLFTVSDIFGYITTIENNNKFSTSKYRYIPFIWIYYLIKR